MSVEIPESFRKLVSGRPAELESVDRLAGGRVWLDGDSWLRALPRLVDDHLTAWNLTPDGPAWHGECALVLPVVRADGGPAVLKLTWPHAEARLEHLALRVWNGRGAVRLLAADPAADVLLLERLDGNRDLTGVPILEACEVIGELFRELDVSAPPQVERVADKAGRWQEQLSRTSPLVPRRLSQQAIAMMTDLVSGPAANRLVHEDLHDMNVLAPLDAGRGAWLAIDPKPVAGEWAYAVAPIVWNREDAAERAHSLRMHVRLRAQVVADAAGLDVDRVGAWTFVRLVMKAVWAAEYAPAAEDYRGSMIALAKAFGDPLG